MEYKLALNVGVAVLLTFSLVFGVENSAKKCDPSYPTVCIPPPPPDLDCKDIPYRNFKVLPPDPHGFDGDGDGIGCEDKGKRWRKTSACQEEKERVELGSNCYLTAPWRAFHLTFCG